MMELLYLSRADVERVGISMEEIIEAVEQVFVEKGRGRVEMPPKPGIHPRPDAFIHAMPAYIPGISAAGIKWVSGYPENSQHNLPYITGLIVLNDPDTGLPIAVMDATWITAVRTGAATAVAVRYLARRDSRSVAVIGCGIQGRTNLEALKVVLPTVECVYAYDVSDEAVEAYAHEMRQRFAVDVVRCGSVKEAVRDADIVVTATPILKHPRPVIEERWLQPGVFACPLDFDSCFMPEAFSGMDKLYTDDTEQQHYYVSAGYFQRVPKPHGDLGEVVVGKKPGRERDDERIMSVNLGVAIEDMATAIRVYRKAREKSIGRLLPL